MDQSTCYVSGCLRPLRSKAATMCDAHYKRWWRSGDVDEVKAIAEPRADSVPVRDFSDGTRICQKCGARKSLDEFHYDKKAPLGKRKECKVCRRNRENARYAERPEYYRDKYRIDRANNRERYRAVDLARYERHREERIERATEGVHIRRARMAAAGYEPGISRSSLRKLDGDLCCYCEGQMVFGTFARGERPSNMATIEHVIPVSLGGSHTLGNCALACWRCNSSRSNRDGDWAVRSGHRLASM